MSERPPTFWLIAGPNGVGKTTFAFKRLEAVSGSINFVNMDEIARGLSPLRPALAERDAARIALERARHFIRDGATFAMETTMSGSTHLGLLREAAESGLRTSLLFFSANDPAICMTRIARRVAEGGHDVPEDVVRRRFNRGLENLARYTAEADLWRVYECSRAIPQLAVEGNRETVTHRQDEILDALHPAARALIASQRKHQSLT